MVNTKRKKKGKKGTKKVVAAKLPKHVRDELQMSWALKGYSIIKCGKCTQLRRQEMELERFYHGHEPNYPSQIVLLANASYSYRELYDGSTLVSTNKDNSLYGIIAKTLKDCYTRGSNVKFHSGIDITSLDLEKRLLTGNQQITGRRFGLGRW